MLFRSGVWFKVLAADISGDKPGPFVPLFEKATKAHEWIPCAIPLQQFAGRRMRFKFLADCGPKDNTVTDRGFWADVKIMRAGAPESAITPSASLMTWLNDRPLTSAFYFRDVRSKSVDLTLAIEGREPVTITTLSAHAHPDAMYRTFENGLVIANPSQKPYTFDLNAISPGRNYRRIKASPTQDTQANNGQPAQGNVSLAERDALFLVRQP